MPASRVLYVPEAQGSVLPVPHALHVLATRTSHARAVRTAHRGDHRRLPAGWEEVEDGDQVYYYNSNTGESLWERPKAPRASAAAAGAAGSTPLPAG